MCLRHYQPYRQHQRRISSATLTNARCRPLERRARRRGSFLVLDSCDRSHWSRRRSQPRCCLGLDRHRRQSVHTLGRRGDVRVVGAEQVGWHDGLLWTLVKLGSLGLGRVGDGAHGCKELLVRGVKVRELALGTSDSAWTSAVGCGVDGGLGSGRTRGAY